jgi:hypothetical protein
MEALMRNGDEMVQAITRFVCDEFSAELHALTLQVLNLTEESWAAAAEYVDSTEGSKIRQRLHRSNRIMFEKTYESYYQTQSMLAMKLLIKAADGMSYHGNLHYGPIGDGLERKVFSL